MSNIRLFIARHGETEYNKKGLLQGRGIDAPLNETGLRQAEAISNYLIQYKPYRLISSSMQRAWQTAEPIENKAGLTILKNGDLDEMDFGKFEGKPYLDASEELQDLQKSWMNGDVTRPIPEGESPRDVFDRANGAVQDLLMKSDDGVMVMVLHGRLIRILLSEWLGFGLANMHKVEHQNGALYQLVYNGKFESVYLNKTDHL